MDEDLLPFYAKVPKYVVLNSRVVPIEWTDAVHLATMFSRGEEAVMATTDGKVKQALTIEGRSYFSNS
jgi:hypothetical protein